MDEDAGRENLSTNLRYNSGRGQSQVGLVFRTGCGYSFCALTGRKPGDPFSWYTRQYTQEETELTSSFGYARRMQVSEFTDRTEVVPK